MELSQSHLKMKENTNLHIRAFGDIGKISIF